VALDKAGTMFFTWLTRGRVGNACAVMSSKDSTATTTEFFVLLCETRKLYVLAAQHFLLLPRNIKKRAVFITNNLMFHLFTI
jgi:hypothetical protein